MIDDWVYMSENDIPRRITDIGRFDLISSYGITCYVDNIHPIPITPEILEKNGFELGGVLHNTYSVGDSNYTITIGKYGRGQCDIMNHLFHIGVTMECCGTVHELQHALRICGIEKEIDLC